MLKGIPGILSPELLKIMMEMGHGDELVIADGNFPRIGYPSCVVRLDGHGIPEILDAVLQFFPLDKYVDHPVTLMEVIPGDPYIPEIRETYREIGNKYQEGGLREAFIPRFEFYDRTVKSYAVVTTSENSLYANIILKKGVV